MYDVAIVGGGPAGLNAALILGRCRRRVLLCDDGEPRNAVSPRVSGFLSRDGIAPMELRRIGREQLDAYPGVEVRDVAVTAARKVGDGFALTLADGSPVEARKLLLATGLTDDLPDIPGFRAFYGRGVYNCPYCDGWENRDRPLAVFAPGRRGVGLAVELLVWSRDIVLCTGGPADLSPEDRDRLDRHRIAVVANPVERLEGGEGGLERIVFAGREPLACRALFFIYGEHHPSELVEQLGCDLSDTGTVPTRSYERTVVPGLYVAGDASRRVQFAIVAAAEGAMAAFAINTELTEEDFA